MGIYVHPLRSGWFVSILLSDQTSILMPVAERFIVLLLQMEDVGHDALDDHNPDNVIDTVADGSKR